MRSYPGLRLPPQGACPLTPGSSLVSSSSTKAESHVCLSSALQLSEEPMASSFIPGWIPVFGGLRRGRWAHTSFCPDPTAVTLGRPELPDQSLTDFL